MAGVYKLEIQESEDEVKQMLRAQKTASGKERIHLLYLLKSQQAKTVQDAALSLGRHRATLHEWLKYYREGGIEELLKSRPRSGRPWAIPAWALAALQQCSSALYETFEPQEAKRILDKLDIHYTPKQGSWLNMAEIELSMLARQCLDRRIPDAHTLKQEVATWQTRRNQQSRKIEWHFTTEDARIKLKRLYPSILS